MKIESPRMLFVVVAGILLSLLIEGTGYALRQSSNPKMTAFDSKSNYFLRLTNDHRTAAGLGTLHLNQELQESAALKCQDILKRHYWGHITPDGKDASYFINLAGISSFSKVGENLAIGQVTIWQADEDWMKSAGHRANILDGAYTDVGFAQCTYASENSELPPLRIYVEQFLAK